MRQDAPHAPDMPEIAGYAPCMRQDALHVSDVPDASNQCGEILSIEMKYGNEAYE
jgi:hypothetical protein